MHAHSLDDDRVSSAAVPRTILLLLLAAVAVATVVGLVRLWPDHHGVAKATKGTEFAAPGVTFPKAEITKITKGCGGEAPSLEDAPDASVAGAANACELAHVKVLTGPRAGTASQVQLQGPLTTSGLGPGDRLELMSIPGQSDPSAGGQPLDSVFGVDRSHSLAALAIAFVVIVLVVAWLRGLLALLALVFSGFMLVRFILPALVSGRPGLAVALVGSSAIMFVVLYVAHGPSVRTSTALAGTLCGIGVTAAVAQYAVGSSHLSGIGDESAGILSGMAGHLDFRGLLACAVVIAGLGVLNDVTITQASAVWELRAAGPQLSRGRIFAGAMRIGRDHIASTIYTVVFAYAGAALSVLLLLYLYDRPLLELLTQEDIATEVVRTLCSAIGLVLAVPVTTAIATLLVPAEPAAALPRGRHERAS